jgi:ABC-type sugar transport system permease subunit
VITVAGARMKGKKPGTISIRQKNAITGYLFILPWILGFILFTGFPFFYSIFLSFSSVKIAPTGIQTRWIGIGNYVQAFTKDVNFPVALSDSFIFVLLSTPMIVVASLIMAMLLNGKFRGRTIFRAIFFLPVIIISGPVISELLTNNAAQIVNPSKYTVYKVFSTLPEVIGAPVLYVFDNLVMILWFSGVQILIFLASLQKIDGSIYEAARIDGASSWEIFWKIVLPYLKPVIMVNAIYTVVEMSGFPNNRVNMEISKNMFLLGNVYSYSAAQSWIYFSAELLLLGVVFLLFREKKKRWKR